MSNHEPPKKSRKNSRVGASEITFINHNLTKDERDVLDHTDLVTDLPFHLALDCVQSGYRFTISFNEKNRCYSASLTDTRADSPHNRKCLSGRGATTVDAWFSLAFRHFVLAQEDWDYFGDVAADSDRGTIW